MPLAQGRHPYSRKRHVSWHKSLGQASLDTVRSHGTRAGATASEGEDPFPVSIPLASHHDCATAQFSKLRQNAKNPIKSYIL